MKKLQLFSVRAAYRGDLAAFVPRASRCVASGKTRHVVRLGPVHEDEDEDEKKDEIKGGAGTVGSRKGTKRQKVASSSCFMGT